MSGGRWAVGFALSNPVNTVVSVDSLPDPATSNPTPPFVILPPAYRPTYEVASGWDGRKVPFRSAYHRLCIDRAEYSTYVRWTLVHA